MSTVKEISIFKPPSAKKTLTKTERQLLFEQLRIKSKLPRYHFEAFQILEEELLDEEGYNSNIPALMIKNIVDHISPIVKKKTSKEFSISVQLNVPIQTKTKDLRNGNIIASNDKMDVIGVVFNSEKSSISRIDLPTISQTSSTQDRIASGSYSLYSWRHLLNKPGHVTDQKYFQAQLDIAIDGFTAVVMFTDKNVLPSLVLLGKYIQYMHDYYMHSLFFMYSSILENSKKVVPKYYKHGVKKAVIKSPLIKALNDVYANNMSPVSRVVLMYDIMYGNLWRSYQFAKIIGIDHKKTSDELDREKERQAKNHTSHKNELREIKQKHQYYNKKAISLRLFNKSDYKQLSEKELDVINLTYAKEIEFSKRAIDNKCQHLRLLTRVMRSADANQRFDRRAWEELKLLFPYDPRDPKSRTDLIKCKSCNLLVLCPHHYDQFEFQKGKDKTVTDSLLRKLLLRKYADRTPIKNAYYCKICGEQIVKRYTEKHAAFIQGEKVHVTREIDTMNNRIWKEVRNIINNNIEFNITTDVNVMTSNITTTIQPYIEEEQEKLRRIKTNTPDIVRSGVYLFISIYAFASITRLVSHYPDDMQFKRAFTGFKKKHNPTSDVPSTAMGGNSQPGKVRIDMRMLQTLMKVSIGTILKTKKSLIDSIPHISSDAIKPLIVIAYKHISKLYVKMEQFNVELPPEYVANSIVYSYIYYIKAKTNRKLKYSDVRSILGIDLTELKNLDTMTDKTVIPKMWKPVESDESPGVFYNKKMYDDYSKYSYASFLHFIKYVKSGLYMLPVFNSIKHQAHEKEYNALFAIERKFLTHYDKMFALPVFYYYNEQHGEFNFKKVDLLTIYCDDGRKHKFNIHVYEHGMTRLEVSKKNVDEWMFDVKKNKEFMGMKQVDLKCSVCGVFLSKATKSKANITQVLNTKDEINGFYNLYTFKCPVKNLHVFKNDACIQCAVTKTMIFKRDRKYFDKYKKDFQAGVKHQSKKVPTQIPPMYKKPLGSDWKITDSAVHELARISKTSFNLLNNIGLIEGSTYDKITLGELNPSEEVSGNVSNRVTFVENHMTKVLVEYEMLRNGRINVPQLEELVEKWDSVDFSKFPDIATIFQAKKAQYKRDDVKYTNFVLHSLATALITIFKHSSNDNYAAAASAFVNYIVKKIINAEKLFSMPGILRGKILEIETDDVADAIEADYDDRNVDAGDGYDPFSLESTGIDAAELNENMVTGDD